MTIWPIEKLRCKHTWHFPPPLLPLFKIIPCMKKLWKGKKRTFLWKNHAILFQLSAFFFNIRIDFVAFILCHKCFFLSLIFDYWWLHMLKSFDVKTIWANNNNFTTNNFVFSFEWEPCTDCNQSNSKNVTKRRGGSKSVQKNCYVMYR